VSKVWNTVDNHRSAGLTSVIHGKYSHEETIATASFCDTYIIIKVEHLHYWYLVYWFDITMPHQDLDEAQYVVDYILNGGSKEEFMKKFAKAVSDDFDPDVHLQKVGLANQTTMYKRETKEIGRQVTEFTIFYLFVDSMLGYWRWQC